MPKVALSGSTDPERLRRGKKPGQVGLKARSNRGMVVAWLSGWLEKCQVKLLLTFLAAPDRRGDVQAPFV
jgi:hypothetical protein